MSAGRRVGGFSLVELMVAMTIALILFAGAISIFVTSRSTAADTDRIGRLQDAGRVALDFIVRDVRSAALTACLRRAYLPIDPNRPPTWDNIAYVNKVDGTNAVKNALWDFRRSLVAYDGVGGVWSAGGTVPTMDASFLTISPIPAPGPDYDVPNSDVLVVRGPTRDGPYLTLAAPSATGSLTPFAINPVPGGVAPPAPNQYMLITDCEFAGVFRVSAFSANQISHGNGGAGPGFANNTEDSANPFPAFQRGAMLMPIRTAIYFVAPSSADNNQPSLWRRVTNPATAGAWMEELIEGVEAMQVMVAVADGADGQASRYVNPTEVPRWEDVVGVQVALLIRSPSQEASNLVDTRTYTLLDAPVFDPVDDRRQRAVFTTTATLRNWAR